MIKIQNLHLRYPDGTHALKGINLAISEGEFLLLCGANGSGKTTLIRLICGLIKPTTGSIHVNGMENPYHSKAIRRLVGMVFQDSDSQIVGETVREDVAFGPENLGLSRDEIHHRVEGALGVMNLKGLEEKSCHLLSGGEKKRLAIAGVLAMKPRIILFHIDRLHRRILGLQTNPITLFEKTLDRGLLLQQSNDDIAIAARLRHLHDQQIMIADVGIDHAVSANP